MHDQGEVLWAAKCRLEDVHKRTEETGQKVLEQGQVSWESRDRIEDIYLIVDSFLAHPQYGASKKSHNAVNMITSLLTLPAAEQRRTLCEQFLSSIEIETFSFCNRQCWFCPNHIVDRHSKNEYMDEAVYLKILSELREIHYTSKIAFSRYNEPFADRIILTRIRQAREYCPKAYLHSNTNGDYLSREYLDEIAHAGLDELEVQCYFGENENFSFTRYLERLESLAEKLCIRNYHIVEKKENDRFRAVLDYDGLRLTFFSLNMKEYANNRGETLEHTRVYQRKENCLVPFRKLYVDYNGSYVMCCNVRSDIKKHHDFVLGDAKKDSVFDVFCGEKMITIRKMVGSVCNLTAPCKSCQYLTVDDDFNIFKQEG